MEWHLCQIVYYNFANLFFITWSEKFHSKFMNVFSLPAFKCLYFNWATICSFMWLYVCLLRKFLMYMYLHAIKMCKFNKNIPTSIPFWDFSARLIAHTLSMYIDILSSNHNIPLHVETENFGSLGVVWISQKYLRQFTTNAVVERSRKSWKIYKVSFQVNYQTTLHN